MRFFAAAPFLLCAALYAAVLGGYFLSDDLALVHLLATWRDHGELWSRIASKFATGLDTPSHYYRPLAYLSYGIDFTLFGLRPLPWHLVNLVAHLAAGFAVYRIVAALAPAPASRFGPAVGAGLFLLCGTNAESVAWISGRFDVFATMFSLWAGALYLSADADANTDTDARRSQCGARTGTAVGVQTGMQAPGRTRPWSGAQVAALACGALAFASKESAAVLPGLIACLAWIRHGGLEPSQRWRAILRDLVPWIVLVVAYAALRQMVFGTMLQVYPDTRPLERLSDGTLFEAAAGFPAWLAAAVPNVAGLVIAAMLGGWVLAVAATRVRRGILPWRPLTGMLVATLWSLALLLPHLAGLPSNGEGGRLLYTTCALAGIVFGLALQAPPAWVSAAGGGLRATHFAGLALLAVHATLLHAALRDWRHAGAGMGALAGALPRIATEAGADGYAFVFAPDAQRAVPFARNGNTALTGPPVQQEELLRRTIVLLPAAIPDLPGLVRRGFIPNLRAMKLDASQDTRDDAAGGGQTELVWPSAVYCWQPAGGRLVRLALPALWPEPARWVPQVRDGLRLAGCAAS